MGARYRRWLVALVVLVMLGAAGVAYLATRHPRGEPTPQAVVDEYLAALAARDPGRLARIADPQDDPTAEIPSRIDRFGGGRFVVRRELFNDTESDHMKNATLSGSLDGVAFSDVLWLHLRGDRWYVELGPSPTSCRRSSRVKFNSGAARASAPLPRARSRRRPPRPGRCWVVWW